MKFYGRNPEGPVANRSAGVLMHLTALPGRFGIGDMGHEARRFADFLHRARQTYWQLLPLNPIEQDKGYSPYSSISSIAGNTLLISPELLMEEGWLTTDHLNSHAIPSQDKVAFTTAESIKQELLEEAYIRFKKSRAKRPKQAFEDFCKTEKSWLDDFAMYVCLKEMNHGKPWYEWPEPYRDRERKLLEKLSIDFVEVLDKTKWFQFVFFSQWKLLKAYCNAKGVRLFGDLPFYVGYDSADVWAFRNVFDLDKKGHPRFVAGVPPDYFNEDGQLWGMPVFRWDVLRKQGYSWWITRLKKNMALFDLLRLDHFRAFADYWAVPSNASTAKNGNWKRGPGKNFFEVVRRRLGTLPFVAEDLGDINEDVYALRETFGFPGMKVLHFAFAENMAQSDYIPHNYTDNFVVYTGTHDNNTTKGWFRSDATKIEKENLKRYFGSPVSSTTINTLIIRLAYASVAKMAIIPVQDLLGLDERARFNAPATIKDNWQWRMLPGSLTDEIEKWLTDQMEIFSRS